MNVVPAPPDTTAVILPVGSEAEAMDWSLVLASQDIGAVILSPAETGDRWAVSVSPGDLQRTLRELGAFRRENRRWRTPVAVAEESFHWGALLWLLFLAVIFAMDEPDGALTAAGRMDAVAVRTGEAWRVITATTLHANIAHLMANLSLGFALVGLAMGRLGFGATLLATLLCGVAGNLLGLVLRPAYLGVGASGAVMGAVGLLAAAAWRDRRAAGARRGVALTALGAGTFLFLLFGVDPKSDVVAHWGGFLAGLPLGWLLGSRRVQRRAALAEGVGVFTYAALILGAWTWALRAG
ncbi:MAG: rhomboid family intramembrane serine protease [Limisphaerales bacterium]